MTTFRDLPALGAAINRESYEWLTDNLPWLADAPTPLLSVTE